MTPKISVRPAAIRNSMTPNCSPLRSCSIKRAADMENIPFVAGPCACGQARPIRPVALHVALVRVSVAAIFQRGADDDVGQPVTMFHHLAHVDILHGMVVRPECEIAARAVEISGAQRLAE